MGKQSKRPPRHKVDPQDALREQLERKGLFGPGARLRRRAEPPEGPSLSGRVMEVVDPYRPVPARREKVVTLVTLGVAAWNAALLDEAERQALLDTVADAVARTAGPAARAEAQATLQLLVARKLALFPDDLRFVVDYRLSGGPDEVQLTVASLVKPGA